MFSRENDSLHSLLWQVIRQHFIRYHSLLGKIGLHKGQPIILALLWKQDGLTQKEIAESLGLRPPTLTVMLRRMEKAGLLKRMVDVGDMRMIRVYLTEKGREIREQVEEINQEMEKECFSGLTMEEKNLLRRFFTQVRDNLKRINDGEDR